jgi:hypothetical protein
MAAGPGTLGLAYFAGVKLAGYCGAAAFLNRRFADRKANVLFAGAARTAIGLVAGIGAVAALSTFHVGRGEWLFLVFLVPLRIAEWLLLLWLFYRRPSWDSRVMLRHAGLGTVWSFCLDLPALLAVFVLPGGVWIC